MTYKPTLQRSLEWIDAWEQCFRTLSETKLFAAAHSAPFEAIRTQLKAGNACAKFNADALKEAEFSERNSFALQIRGRESYATAVEAGLIEGEP